MKTPALDAWRRELAAGVRTRETFDTLWRCACAEMNAVESVWRPALVGFYLAEVCRLISAARKGAAA